MTKQDLFDRGYIIHTKETKEGCDMEIYESEQDVKMGDLYVYASGKDYEEALDIGIGKIKAHESR